MLSISLFSEDGKTIPQDGAYTKIHATWAGRCLHVPSEAFWPWATGMVGMTIEGQFLPNSAGLFMDFDVAEAWSGGTTYGLEVTGGKSWGQSTCESDRRTVTLTLGEFWDALTMLAEKVA